MESFILDLQLASTAALFGLIWTVQLLIYPAFQDFPKERLLALHVRHTDRITYVAAPLMIIELGASILILTWGLGIGSILNLASVAVLWALTGLVSVRLHNRIAAGNGTPDVLARLVLTNWPRTVLWSLRLVVLLFVRLP